MDKILIVACSCTRHDALSGSSISSFVRPFHSSAGTPYTYKVRGLPIASYWFTGATSVTLHPRIFPFFSMSSTAAHPSSSTLYSFSTVTMHLPS